MFKNYKPRKRKIIKSKRNVKNPYEKNSHINSSKLETFFETHVLKALDVKYSAQKKVSTKYYDFYLPEYNLLIEVDGDYYHAKDREKQLNAMQKKNILNDHKKNLIAESKGFNMIRFWESTIKNKTLTVLKDLKEELRKIDNTNN